MPRKNPEQDPPSSRADLFALVSAVLVTAGAAIVYTYDSLGLSRFPAPHLIEHLRATSAVLWVTWGILRGQTSLTRRLNRLEEIVGQRYEEGYAAGYVDGAARTSPTEHSSGTVYSINGERPARHR